MSWFLARITSCPLRRLLACCLLLVSAVLPLQAWAVDGGTDPGFVSAINGAKSIALQSNGKIVAARGANTSQVARLNVNGSLDANFGSDCSMGICSVDFVTVALDDSVLAAGTYQNYNGSGFPNFVKYDASGASSTPLYHAGVSYVLTADVLSDGKTVVAGSSLAPPGYAFNLPGQNVQPGIARRLADGSADSSFDPGSGINFYSHIFTLAVQSDGKYIIGGNFTSYNSVGRNRIARIDASGALDTSFDPGAGVNGNVQAIVIQPDQKIIIAGDFTTLNGFAANGIARLNSDGSRDAGFNAGTDVDNSVNALALQPDGKILVGTATRLVRLNTDGTLDTSFNSALSQVNAILLQTDGKALVAGDSYIVRLSTGLSSGAELSHKKGTTKNEQLGSSIAMADMNNDGVVDVLVGAPMANVSADGKILKKAGKIQIVSGKDNAVLRTLNGTATNQQFGTAIAVANDQDSDNVPDIIVGEPLADRVAIYSGSDGALIDVIAEGEAGEHFGAAVAVGDLNNDAVIDLIVGAPLADALVKNCGVVTVFNGISNHVLYRRKGDQAGEQFGAAVAVNDQQQVLIGAPLHDLRLAIDSQVVKRKDAGRVQIFAGAAASSSALLRLNGAAVGDHFGAAISAANNSWAVGIPLADGTGMNAGAVQLFSVLNTNPITTLNGVAAGDRFGSALNMHGDVNQDGTKDIAVGATKFDVSTTVNSKAILLKDAGRVEVLSGAVLATP